MLAQGFWLVLVAGSVLLAMPRLSVAQRVELRVDLDERVNAVYHLVCLAGSIECTRDVFERLWKQRLGWTDTDQAAFDTWRETFRAVTSAAQPRPPAPWLGNTPSFHPGQWARTAVIVAALESESAGDLVRRSQGLLDAQRAASVTQAVDHVARRIRPWFRDARRAIERRVGQVRAEARRRGFDQTAARMAAFLEADLPTSQLYVHTIVGPEPASADFSAHPFGRHFVVEVVDAAGAKDIVTGATHELTHYLYDLAPAEKHRALMEQFIVSGAPSAAGLYTYLNEALAIAAQELRPSNEPRTEEDSYRHPYIPYLGEAAIPLVRDAVAGKRTLFDGFVPGYVAAGREALKDKLVRPPFVLAQIGLLLPDDADAIRATYVEKMIPRALAQFSHEREADAFPDLNLVRMVRYGELDSLGGPIADLGALRSHRGFVYAIPRGRGGHTYVVAGRDDAALSDVIGRLAELPGLEPRGLVLSLD